MAKKTKVNIFEDMREGLRDALAFERGEALNLRVTKLLAPPQAISPREIRRIRRSLHASQTLFADYLGTGRASPATCDVETANHRKEKPKSTHTRVVVSASA
jgi:DNA-binding transcriptional regulator YiaG